MKLKPGDRAIIRNQKLDGTPIVEGVATLVSRHHVGHAADGETWRVSIEGDDADSRVRFVRFADVVESDDTARALSVLKVLVGGIGTLETIRDFHRDGDDEFDVMIAEFMDEILREMRDAPEGIDSIPAVRTGDDILAEMSRKKGRPGRRKGGR